MRLTPRPRLLPERPLTELRNAVQNRSIDKALNTNFDYDETSDAPLPEHSLTIRERFSFLRGFLSTTPGKFSIVTTLLLICCIVLGGAAAALTFDRQQELDTMLNESEPLAHASQQLYSSLSLANTAATTQFMTSAESEEVARQYERAIIDASVNAIDSRSSTSAHGKEDRDLIVRINASIPVYTARIGQALAEQSMNNPLTTIHQSDAQSIMDEHLLPEAEQLYKNRYASINVAQKAWARPLYAAGICLIFLIAALVAAQLWLTHVTRRRFNGGLLAATVLAILSLLWVLVSSGISLATADSSASSNHSISEVLTDARIITQQMRSGEMMELSQSNAGSPINPQPFHENMDTVASALDTFEERSGSSEATDLTNQTRTALHKWEITHQKMVTALHHGDRKKATTIATSMTQENGGGQFNTVDTLLQRCISSARNQVRDSADLAHSTIFATGVGLVILLVLEAGCIVAGFLPRYREYE